MFFVRQSHKVKNRAIAISLTLQHIFIKDKAICFGYKRTAIIRPDDAYPFIAKTCHIVHDEYMLQ